MQLTVEEMVTVPRKLWTREEAHALVDLGFPNAEKLELIEGELINRMGKKHVHLLWQNLMHEWLRMVFGSEFVRTQSPTDVAPGDNQHNETEPDFVVHREPVNGLYVYSRLHAANEEVAPLAAPRSIVFGSLVRGSVSVVTKQGHGIHLHRSPGWNVAGANSRHYETERNGRKR